MEGEKRQAKQMVKTNDRETIRKSTGLGLGSLFYAEKGIEISSADFYQEDDYIYDTESRNFHFLPVITDDNRVLWQEYLDQVTAVQAQIRNRLKDSAEWMKPDSKIITGTGNITSLCGYEKDRNRFFKYLSVHSEKLGYFTINFMRWYIDREKNVNCRLGELQFDYTKDRKVNCDGIIQYPTSFRGQNLAKITIHEQVNSCIYNPPALGNIWQLDPDRVVESFAEFVRHVTPLIHK